MNKKLLVGGAVVLGIVFIILALVYWLLPAGSLPSFLPGYEHGSVHIHFKHGLGTFLLGCILFVYAWFATGKKSS